MTYKHMIVVALLAVPGVKAEAQTHQYISDEITLSIRDQPSNSGTVIGSAQSGEPVVVLQTLGEQSFARVRTQGGVEGWVTARFLSDHPAAKDQLKQTRDALEAARKQSEALQHQIDGMKEQLAGVKPAQEMAADNKNLRAELALKESEGEQLKRRYDEETAQRQTLLVGGTLVVIGIIVGLLLPWLGQRKRRRYSDF